MKAKELGGTILESIKSDTNDSVYDISWSKLSGYSCTCSGFTASRKKPKVCKHIKRYEFKYQIANLYGESVAESTLEIAKQVWEV
jgi:hypothetical protein